MGEFAGLNQLDERRQTARARRNVPPPKHPKVVVRPEEPVTEEPGVVDSREPPPQSPALPEGEPEPSANPVRRRSRVRPTQVHLDELSEEHLGALKKRAVMLDVPLTSSGVLRMALAELVDRYGYDRIVGMFADDPRQPRPGRPRG